ncbi:MAG: TY-Chap domain-containing protein [Iamia sp.]
MENTAPNDRDLVGSDAPGDGPEPLMLQDRPDQETTPMEVTGGHGTIDGARSDAEPPSPSDVDEPGFLSEDFTLRPKDGGGFGMVEAALARKLWSLAPRHSRTAVIVSIKDGGVSNHFTQTLVDWEDGAWVEAVSNTFIESADHQISDDQTRLLTGLGFEPPTDEMPNHFVVYPQPVDWSHVAALVVRTLESVYGVPASAVIQVQAFTVDRADHDDDEESDPGPGEE